MSRIRMPCDEWLGPQESAIFVLSPSSTQVGARVSFITGIYPPSAPRVFSLGNGAHAAVHLALMYATKEFLKEHERALHGRQSYFENFSAYPLVSSSSLCLC